MARIAEIDCAILAHLRRNGRMSCVELAKDIGASEKTIRTHMKKMEENGIIRGYTIREGGGARFDCIGNLESRFYLCIPEIGSFDHAQRYI